jgi:hypothetical protein
MEARKVKIFMKLAGELPFLFGLQFSIGAACAWCLWRYPEMAVWVKTLDAVAALLAVRNCGSIGYTLFTMARSVNWQTKRDE